MRLLIFFTSPASALYEYAPFMSPILLMTELEAVKEDRFHPLNIFWHRWGASSLSLCAINAIVDFFHISCISALRICTIHVINIDNCNDRDHQRGQISSPQQIGTNWEQAHWVCVLSTQLLIFYISCISSSQICTIHVININNCWAIGSERGQISPPQQIVRHR